MRNFLPFLLAAFTAIGADVLTPGLFYRTDTRVVGATNLYFVNQHITNSTIDGVPSSAIATNSAANKLDTTNGVAVNLDLTGSTVFDLGEELSDAVDYSLAVTPNGDTSTSNDASPRPRSVVTISSLITDIDPLLVPTYAQVNTLGYFGANDGGGGTFRRVLSGSVTTNSFNVFRSTYNSLYAWERVLIGQQMTAQMFGARGNNISQDYLALQSAVSYAVTNRLSLRIPAGTYLLTNKLVIPVSSSGWSITGDGAGSILKQTASSGNGTPIFEFAGGGIDRFSISDLALEWSDVGGVPASGFKNVGFMFAWDGTSDKGTGVYNFTLSGLAFTFGFRCLGNYDLSATSSSGVNVWGMTLKSSRATYMAGGVVLLSNAGSGGSPNVTIADFHVNGTTYGQPVATSPFIYSDAHFFCDSATGWSFHGVELNNVASSVPVWQFTGPASQIVFDNCRTEAMLLATNRAMMEFDNVGVTIGSFDFSNINVRTNIAGTLIKFDNSNTATAAHELVINSLDHQGNPTYPTVNLQSGASLTLVDAAVGTLAFVGNLPPVEGATTYGRSGPMLNGAANWRVINVTAGTNYTPTAASSTNVPNWYRVTCASNTLVINAVTGAMAGAEYVFDLSSAAGTRLAWISPTYQVTDIDRNVDAGDRKVLRFLFDGTNMVQSASLPAWGGGNRVLLANANQGGIAAVDFSIGTLANTPTNRWRLGTDGTTESGSNAGSNLTLTRFSDTGSNIGTPISINRATGQTTLSGLTVGTSLMSVNSGNTGDSLVRTNGGWYPLPVTGGGLGGGTGSADNRLLRADGTGGATVQNSAVVVEDYTGSTANNVAIRVDDGTTANISAVITPKGSGAFIAGPRPDGTAAGGNARGSYASDLQIARNVSAQVASGTSASVVGGMANTASGTYATAGGYGASATAESTVALGSSPTASGLWSVALGRYASASGVAAVALGRDCAAVLPVQIALGGQLFGAVGDNQTFVITLRNSTASTTPVVLFADSGGTRLSLPNDTLWSFTIMVAGTTATGTSQRYAYKFEGIISRGTTAGSTTMPVAATKTVIFEHDAAADATATADTTNGALSITITPANATATRWSATVICNQLGFP